MFFLPKNSAALLFVPEVHRELFFVLFNYFIYYLYYVYIRLSGKAG